MRRRYRYRFYFKAQHVIIPFDFDGVKIVEQLRVFEKIQIPP